ncbi:hypothetical protein H0H87_007294, partial [Tephrocybe sp. NHM501043]
TSTKPMTTSPSTSKPNTKAPPLIIADSVKFSTPSARKPSSPTPSSKSTSTAPAPASNPPSKAVTLPKPKKSSSSNSNSGRNTPTPSSTPRPPSLLLPTWDDTFHTLPRTLPSSSSATPSEGSRFGRAVRCLVSGVLSPTTTEHNRDHDHDRVLRCRAERYATFGGALPRTYVPAPPALSSPLTPSSPYPQTPATPASAKSWFGGTRKAPALPPRMGDKAKAEMEDVLRGCRRVLVIGVHGWFPGAIMRSVIGEV